MNIQKHLQDKLETLESRIAASPYTAAQASEQHLQLMDVVAKIEGGAGANDLQKMDLPALGLHNDIEDLEKIKESLSLDLAEVTTRYVMTDAPLVSPSGFHASDLVFIVTNIFIQTDRLPKFSNLKVFDMQKVA